MADDILIQENRQSAGIVEDMSLIPLGEFLMGSNDGGDFERPLHKVFLDAYYLDITPVTNEQFASFVAATGYRTTAEHSEDSAQMPGAVQMQVAASWRTFATPERKDHPVICVSWYDAVVFAHWAGKRLPTEAEWEKASRGRLEGRLFPWGDSPADDTRANMNGVNPTRQLPPPTTPVKSFPPNGYGLYDMAGNVWEWCSDWYEDGYYTLSPERNPLGPELGQLRVRRGASWNVREDFRLRCANRGAMPPGSFWPNIGFRCAKSVN